MAILGSLKSHKVLQEERALCLQPLEKQHVGDAGHLSGQSHQTTAAQKVHHHPVLVKMAKHFNEENDFPLSNSQKVQTQKAGCFFFFFGLFFCCPPNGLGMECLSLPLEIHKQMSTINAAYLRKQEKGRKKRGRERAII